MSEANEDIEDEVDPGDFTFEIKSGSYNSAISDSQVLHRYKNFQGVCKNSTQFCYKHFCISFIPFNKAYNSEFFLGLSEMNGIMNQMLTQNEETECPLSLPVVSASD